MIVNPHSVSAALQNMHVAQNGVVLWDGRVQAQALRLLLELLTLSLLADLAFSATCCWMACRALSDCEASIHSTGINIAQLVLASKQMPSRNDVQPVQHAWPCACMRLVDSCWPCIMWQIPLQATCLPWYLSSPSWHGVHADSCCIHQQALDLCMGLLHGID